jgi:hypothetical protein
MTFSPEINNKKNIKIIDKEGFIREALAAYFLSAAPYSLQTPQQKEKHRRMIRYFAEIEELSLLQSLNIRRPLKYGDVNSLINSTLVACSKVLMDKGIVLEVKYSNNCFTSAADPRVVTTALVRLINAAAEANPLGSLYAKVNSSKNRIIISVQGNKPVKDKRALALAVAAARLHKGGIVISEGTTVFSIRAGLTDAVGFFTAPTVDEILKNPLSTVNVGLAY